MKNNKVSLFSGIGFILIGALLFFNPETFVRFVSYSIGGLLMLVGVYKTVNYYIQDKRHGIVNHNEMAFGVTAIVLGVIFFFLADAISLILRFIVGGWVVLAGLNKIMATFYTTNRDSKFYSLIIVGLIFIAIGLYIILVSNLALSIIGLFMLVYGIIDFVSYFVYFKGGENNSKENIKIDIQEARVVSEKEEEED